MAGPETQVIRMWMGMLQVQYSVGLFFQSDVPSTDVFVCMYGFHCDLLGNATVLGNCSCSFKFGKGGAFGVHFGHCPCSLHERLETSL